VTSAGVRPHQAGGKDDGGHRGRQRLIAAHSQKGGAARVVQGSRTGREVVSENDSNPARQKEYQFVL